MAWTTTCGLALVVAACAGSGGGNGNDAPASPTSAAVRYTGPVAAPAGDAFYIPPKVLPAGDPGDILWSRKVPAAGKLKDANFTVYQVLYLSTDTHDQPVAVSGTIVFPPAGSRADMPLLGFATGTHGLGDDCAPSKSLAAGADDWADILELAASHGWAVAATDYEGLGTPGPHTYAVGRAEGHAVLDAARAALRLREGGLSRNAKVGFWGYSQGGGAASWAGELAPGYAPDLNTVGIAAGGVPADLLKVSAGVDGATWAAVEFMAALGFDAAYSELKLDSFVLPAARASLDQLRTACVKQAVLSFAGKHARDVFTTDPLKSTTWQKRLAENSLGSTPPKVPIFLYHGEKDDVVAFGQAESLERTYCAGGADVTWMPIAGANHDAASYLEAEPVAFLADRFAGNPLASTC